MSEMIPSLINFLRKECLRPMCVDFPLYTLVYTLVKMTWLFQCINTFKILSLVNETSNTRFLNPFSSWRVKEKATNYVSMVERVIQVCFLLFQEITPLQLMQISTEFSIYDLQHSISNSHWYILLICQ